MYETEKWCAHLWPMGNIVPYPMTDSNGEETIKWKIYFCPNEILNTIKKSTEQKLIIKSNSFSTDKWTMKN